MREDNIIFNLFIMAFMDCGHVDLIDRLNGRHADYYDWFIARKKFKSFKDCFPDNEYCYGDWNGRGNFIAGTN